ncbi:MAG: ribosome maturation factor RimP [Candidatus Omnitrophota bacterium]
MDKNNIMEELLAFIEKETEKSGYIIVDVKAGRGASFVDVVLDKEGGITLDECAQFNLRICKWTEENDAFVKDVTVDVCSPGLDRELKSNSEFKWGMGKEVEVRFCEPVDGQSRAIGKLSDLNEDRDVTIVDEEGKNIVIEGVNVKKVKLHVSDKI